MSEFIPNEDIAFGQGSCLLITGVSGMIAIHIADEALKAGFRVRGTVRSVEKGHAVAKLLHSPAFEFVVVDDMAADGAFDEAMKGVSAAIHTASIHDFIGNLEDTKRPLLRGSLNILEAASANASVRRVVFTSTTGTAANPRPGVEFHIDRNTWNTEAIDLVHNTSLEKQKELGFEWKMQVYRVAKLEVERIIWDYVKETELSFVVNVVNPALNFGNTKGSLGVSGTQLLSLLDGHIPPIPSLYMVDVVDDARIHVAAAIDTTVANERIFACDEPFTWHRVAQIIHNVLPDANLPRTDSNEVKDISTVDNQLGAELLSKWWRQPGYKGLERTIRETLAMCLHKLQQKAENGETAAG